MHLFRTKYISTVCRFLGRIIGSGFLPIRKNGVLFRRPGSQEIPSLAALSTKNLSPESTRKILSRLDAASQTNLINNMKRLIDERKLSNNQLDEIFPMLATGEKNICRLILEGRSVKEIGLLLQKSISNITCRRTHIRSKLQLSRNDDLRQALAERIREAAVS